MAKIFSFPEQNDDTELYDLLLKHMSGFQSAKGYRKYVPNEDRIQDVCDCANFIVDMIKGDETIKGIVDVGTLEVDYTSGIAKSKLNKISVDDIPRFIAAFGKATTIEIVPANKKHLLFNATFADVLMEE